MSKYTEPVGTGNAYRCQYQQDIERLVWARQAQCKEESLRRASRFTHPETVREEFIRLLGWPLTEYAFSAPPVEKSLVAVDDGVSIYRLQIETLPGFRFYGILFVREDGVPRPLVISQHGGGGTPELCSSLEPNGSSNYNDMTRRVLEQDVNVFAPQLLLWDAKRYFPDAEKADLQRHQWDNRLKQCGGSITALEIYCLRKSLDYLVTQPFVLPDQIGMVGLSYGGFYTLYTAAAEPRIKAAISCSFFNDRGVYCWNDWTFPTKGFFFDPEVAMLCHPRPLYIATGSIDDLFAADTARKEAVRLEELSKAAFGNCDWYEFQIFHGAHEFMKTDDWIIKLIADITGRNEENG